MKISETKQGCLIMAAILAGMVGWSYWEVRAQHGFAPEVAEAMKKFPGTRLVSSFKSGDLANPFSWFWTPTTRLVYAAPDTSMPGGSRFFLMSFGIDEEENPYIMLVDVECDAKKYTYYDSVKPTEANGGELARNVLGEPVTAPNGSIFRKSDSQIPPNPEQLKELCTTDWSKEREMIGKR